MQILKYIVIFSYLISSMALANSKDIKEYAIAIVPNQECFKKADYFNQQAFDILKGKNLKNVKNYWHITLYHGAYKEKDLQKIFYELKDLNLSQFEFVLTDIDNALNRWVSWKIVNNEGLQFVHCQVVDLAGKYSQGPLKRSADIYHSLSAEQQQQVDKYGVSGVLESYDPHITLFYAYPPNDNLQQVASKLKEIVLSETSCVADAIVIGELGYNGNITNIKYKINLLPSNPK